MITLANIFQSGMTLQRQKPILIWGITDIAQDVQVTLNGITVLDSTPIRDSFRLTLPAQAAAEGCTIRLTGQADQIELTDIDIGEVWIAGGQSNMEFLLRYDAEGPEQIASAFDPHCRFYDVGEYAFPGEKEDGFKDNRGWDRWMSLESDNAEYFSAVGYYFARQLRQKLQIPVAIVGCNWGGTTASTWQDRQSLQADPDLSVYVDEYEAGLKKINLDTYDSDNRKARQAMGLPTARASVEKLMTGTTNPLALTFMSLFGKLMINRSLGPHDANRPGGLYEAMLLQIAGYACRGVIWYQGESDADRAVIYGKLLTSMIRDWRAAWHDELPFLIVQLAPFGSWLGITGERYPEVRRQQEWVSKQVPGTALVSIMDAGMAKDIHPKRKRPVGERLALQARGKVYGEDILCDAPELLTGVRTGDTLRLQFAHTGNGFRVQGNRINALQLQVGNKNVKKFTATASGDQIEIRSAELTEGPVTVAFAEIPYCEVNLYSSAGLPAKPFNWSCP